MKHLIFIIISTFFVHAWAADQVDGKIEAASISQLESLLPTLRGESAQKAKFRLANMYRTLGIEGDSAAYEKALKLYKEYLSSNNNSSLETISAKLHMADMVVNLGNYEDVAPILKEIINLKVEEVYKIELEKISGNELAALRLRGYNPPVDSDEYKEAMANAISKEKAAILEQYQDYRKSAVILLGEGVYHKSGVVGLKQLLETYKQDPEISGLIKNQIADKVIGSESN